MVKRIIKYLLLLILASFLLLLFSLFFSYQNLREISRGTINAKNQIEIAVDLMLEKEWDQAKKTAELADDNLVLALTGLENLQSKGLFKYSKILKKQSVDLENLLEAAQAINTALLRINPILKQVDDFYHNQVSYRFSDLSNLDKNNFLELLFKAEPELVALQSLLEIAQFKLSQINQRGLLWPVYRQINAVKVELDQAIALFAKSTPVIKLLPTLLGFPNSSQFLLIMHNTDELRPSGGFIGVYGLLRVDQGEITQLETHDSYHLDMPAVGKWFLNPPAAIKKYMKVENWYLRDANWSPDWPSSARQIQSIYRGENLAIEREPEKFNGVIGITPDFVSALLDLVGPIEAGGEIYDAENLQELLQHTVEVSYLEQNISEWDRKNIINDILTELKDRLLTLKTKDLNKLLTIFDEKIKSKDIQIYFNNKYQQNLIESLEIAGSVKNNESGDYLLVVDANLAAFKTDAVLEKNINYEVLSLSPNSPVSANLELEYKHNGGFDWRTTRYRSYTRVYLPLGSKLNKIKASGQANLEAESISSYEDLELNKTVIAFFFSLEPGTKGTINIEYELPEKIKQIILQNNYNLLVQKQAGRRTNLFKFNFNNDIKLYSLDQDLLITFYAN